MFETNYSGTMKSWHMPHVVSALYSRSTGSSRASSHPVYIPALMPLITFGPMKNTSKPIRSSCFCNDSKCKPSLGSSINTQNYIDVPVYDNNEFRLPTFHLGYSIQVEALSGDYDTLRISNRVDNSTLY